jgi:hypothetical protein
MHPIDYIYITAGSAAAVDSVALPSWSFLITARMLLTLHVCD